ncbi:nicotinate-nucleotide--dimethylbenzimidazole phosphoribosyltransferase [Streptomyces sp. RKAG337]|uniref:nicotinate-nucleotide--dimethylbenzimidazole phosphoribosyltransferase n=1 Tax=Streptomyces sp. RKAG337 TaxID=2893404 RepID=UPI0020331CFB|nr:nicotinate-nucleotide--dimethylbenzimidazole phosphoribosyltransferase [Streptomyces sp. RKAG337]MCM2425605.1 nicotinate-nucleotide--dimethylbenzimidazole phosphoribosyltransferase [Streptomyces sp. RKAG337]
MEVSRAADGSGHGAGDRADGGAHGGAGERAGALPEERLGALTDAVGAFDRRTARLARLVAATGSRPAGSLGRLDEIGWQVAGILRTHRVRPLPVVVSVLAGDHGVAEHGVSAHQPESTALLFAEIVAGRAPVCALASRVGGRVAAADLGLRTDTRDHRYKVGNGTADITRADAMTYGRALDAIEAGARFAHEVFPAGSMAACGEIGVGNTTSAAALAARLLGADPGDLAGRGSGVGEETVRLKARLVQQALERTSGLAGEPVHGGDPVRQLAALGGYELCGNVGLILAAAARGCLVVLDGCMTAVSALIACRLCPQVREYLVASHVSTEPAHRMLLDEMGLKPVLDLEMRLGMGSGAALAAGPVNALLAVTELAAASAPPPAASPPSAEQSGNATVRTPDPSGSERI